MPAEDSPIIAPDPADLEQLDALAESSSSSGFVENDLESNYRWKSHKLTVKEVTDNGIIEGMASVYWVIDSDDEAILPGCFDRSLKHNPHPVVLFQHDPKVPIGFHIGESSAGDKSKGLPVKAELMLDCEQGRYAFAFAKKAQAVGGRVGISVGFRSIKSKFLKGSEFPKWAGADPKKTYKVFEEAQLMEWSLVTWAACPPAYVTAVKNLKQPSLEAESQILTKQELMTDFDSALSERQRQRELARHKSDIDSALYDTLSAIHGGDSDMETKKSMINDCYMKHAKATADWHVATFLSGATKSFNVDLYRKSLGLTNDAPALEEEQVVKTKAAPEPGEEENRSAEEWMFKGGLIENDTKSGKHKLSAAAKAQLAHALDMHKSAMDLTARGCQIVKDMFGDDSAPQVDGSGTEMGAMSDQQPIDAKSEELREEKDTEDLSNFAKELESLTKSRIAAL
jgi:HK97 family phage prohead protease